MCKQTLHKKEAIDGEEPHQQQQVEEIKIEDILLPLCMLSHAGRKRSSSVAPQRYHCSGMQTSLLQGIWTIHFCASFLALLYGSIHNHERKYISVDPSNVPGGCSKAFVDVLSSSDSDEGALVCCPIGEEQRGLLGICDRTPGYLLFANRLSQFPEAWLLPLFPLLIRGIIKVFQVMRGIKPTLAGDSNSTTLRRLGFYLSCILTRGIFLYFIFDLLEHVVVPTPDGDDPCWYRDFLKHFQSPCTGKEFDFSDHVVLYFAQLLPIALSEVLYCLVVPFWQKENRVMPIVLVGGLAYLYFITFLGAYKTAAYFHTKPEIFTGWVVSLLLQVPLCLLQCSAKWRLLRQYLYGQPTTGYQTLVIDDR